jgi:hypothetical protein
MTRICPFCKAKLGLHDRYFCTSCGNNLPAELVESSSQQHKIVKHQVKDSRKPLVNIHVPKPSKKIAEKIGTVFLSAGSSALIALITYTLLAPRIVYKNNIPYIKENQEKNSNVITNQNNTVTPVNQKVINPSCNYLTGKITDANLTNLVPYTADLYMEAYDSISFLKEIVDSGIVDDVKFTSFYNSQKENLTGPLGFFVSKNPSDYTYGIVFLLNDTAKKTELESSYNIVFTDNYAVLTTKTDVIEDLKEIGKGTEKSLTQNPVYASAKSILPKEGKLVIIPITKNGNGFLYQILDKKLTDQFYTIINSFLDSRLDYAVVL